VQPVVSEEWTANSVRARPSFLALARPEAVPLTACRVEGVAIVGIVGPELKLEREGERAELGVGGRRNLVLQRR
jgi:hypothetical protein